jgi:branched-chain amino acid transport system substrate-binding protein
VLDSKALTKIQAVALIAIIVVGAVAGGLAYMFWGGPAQSTENIRIGVCGDLDVNNGKNVWRGAVLAAEQVNAAGGVLGRNLTIVAEDDDSETPPYDIAVATNALTKLITVDKADYIIASAPYSIAITYQDISSQNKKILFTVANSIDNLTQRVLDNYDKYKYYFRACQTNASTVSAGLLGDIIAVGNYTGFTRVALLFVDNTASKQGYSGLSKSLPSHGFEVVYGNFFSPDTTDFTSYFSALEAAGAQILVPIVPFGTSAAFVKEWYERQSPTVLWGPILGASESNFWNLTEGKCDTVSFAGNPAVSGYPLTNKTVPTREAYIQRWGEVPTNAAAGTYDTLRFILPDALKRAGTTETEAVIKALEKTNVETSLARHFVFTSSHDVMVGSDTPNNPAEDYMVMLILQWQNGTQVPVRPYQIMKEAGVTYKYPPWQGPWSNRQTP